MQKGTRIAARADTMQDEYDFSGALRGKYAERYHEHTNLVLLDPDVAELLPTADSVNQALRALAQNARRQSKATT